MSCNIYLEAKQTKERKNNKIVSNPNNVKQALLNVDSLESKLIYFHIY